MKRTILLMAIIAIGILGCSTTIAIENLGTVDYKRYQQVDIIAPYEVELDFLFTTMNESDVSIEKIMYISESNKTKYLITSNIIEPKWWMNFSDISYYYIDENDVLYELKVNYSDVEIPSNPWEIQLDNITGEYEGLIEEYNATVDEFHETADELILRKSQYLDIKEKYDELIVDFVETNRSLWENYTKYNETYSLLLKKGKDEAKYRMFFDDMTDNLKKGFYFNGSYFLTQQGANNQIDSLQNDVNTMPLWVILAIIFTTLILIVMFKLVSSKNLPSKEKIAAQSNYTEDMFDQDKIAYQPKERPPTKESKFKNIFKSKNKDVAIDEKFNDFREEIDTKIDKIETSHKQFAQDIGSKIDQLLSSKGKGTKA